jgi:hypothetical protein
MAVATRKSKKAQVEKTTAHTTYMKTYRTPDIKYKESKLNILRRIRKGSVPQAKSLATYNISLKEINELRIHGGLPPLDLQIPYFMMAKDKDGGLGGNDADYLPDNSQVIQFNDDFDSGENEVTSNQTADPSAPNATLVPTVTYGYTIGEICIWMQNNKGFASSKSATEKRPTTVRHQFGDIDSTTGKFNNSGRLYNCIKLLGNDTYLDDMRLAIKDDKDVAFILSELNKPQKSLLKNVITDKKLSTMIQYLEALLLALRKYPGFDALNNRKYLIPYNQLNKGHVIMQAKISAENLSNPKEKLYVMDWKELQGKVTKKYKTGTKENLYIKMYNEFPSRDDFKDLFIDDVDTPAISYPTQQNYEAILKNTLFVRSDKPTATIVLVDYKTVGIYGKRMYHFTPGLTKDIKAYITNNQLTAKGTTRLLFGATSMSSWVKNLLDSIDVPNPREGQINYLRKSYISSAMNGFKGDAEARIQIAFHLKHSPTASIKYIRDIQKKDSNLNDIGAISEDNLKLSLAVEKTYTRS